MSDSDRLCPACSRIAETQLEPMDAKGVALDYCGSCSGIWLDRGEWTEVFGQAPSEVQAEGTIGEEPLRCPACIEADGRGRQLIKYRLPGGPPVQIDACRGCSGIWLDAGEMQTIKRHYSGAQAGPPPPRLDAVANAWQDRQTGPPPAPSETSRPLGSAHGAQRGTSILLFLAAAVFLALQGSQISIGLASPSWPTVDGEITRRWTESRRETSTRDGHQRRRTVHYDAVEYRYETDGVDRQGKRYNADRRNKFIPSRLTEGAAVTVSYDPDNPARAVIDPGLTFSTTTSFLGGLAAMLLAILGFLGIIDPTVGGRLTSIRWWTFRW